MLLKMYLDALKRYPFRTKVLSTGVLMGSGDILSQFVIEKKSLKEYSIKRTGRFFVFGTVVLGPGLATWYGFLDKVVTRPGLMGGLTKVVMDQTMFAPVILGTFISTMTFWTTYSVDATVNKLKQDYFTMLLVNYTVWPAAQIINFNFVPIQHRVMFANFIALFWNIYLSYKTSDAPLLETAGKKSS